VIIPVAVEKLAHSDFEKVGSRQEALQAISPSLLDIFYHPIFDFFKENRVFQQPPLFSTSIQSSISGNGVYQDLGLLPVCRPSARNVGGCNLLLANF
jgi:hypothetical protein